VELKQQDVLEKIVHHKKGDVDKMAISLSRKRDNVRKRYTTVWTTTGPVQVEVPNVDTSVVLPSGVDTLNRQKYFDAKYAAIENRKAAYNKAGRADVWAQPIKVGESEATYGPSIYTKELTGEALAKYKKKKAEEAKKRVDEYRKKAKRQFSGSNKTRSVGTDRVKKQRKRTSRLSLRR